MQEWTVQGADEKTGKDRILTIAAKTEAEATRSARAEGVYVSAIKPNPGSIAKVETPLYTAPSYTMLNTLASFMTAGGFFTIVLGVVLLMLATKNAVEDQSVQIIAAKAGSVGLMIWGLILAGLGEGLKAIRDIARNSFKS